MENERGTDADDSEETSFQGSHDEDPEYYYFKPSDTAEVTNTLTIF